MAVTEDLKDVEIFAVGTWNGMSFAESDLDEMVDAHKAIGKQIKPFAKLGHDKHQGLLQEGGYPAAGWIDNVRRVGGKMIADFKAVPAKVAELIRRKAYGRFSPEVYFNAVLDGAKYPKVLKAVAILGGDTPACTTLDDFINLYGMKADELVRVFESAVNGELVALQEGENVGEIEALNAKLEVERDARAKAEKNFADAQKAVELANTEKVKAEGLRVEAEKKFADKEKAFALAQISAKAEGLISERLKEGRILPAQVPVLRALAEAEFIASDEKGLRVFSFKEGEKDAKVEFKASHELVFKLLDVLGKQVEFTTVSKHEDKPAANAGEQVDSSELAAETDKAFAEAQKANPLVSYAEVAKEVSRKRKERS